MWEEALPTPVSMRNFGAGTSPIVHGDTLFLNHDTDEGEAYLLALDSKTGKTRWKTTRLLSTLSWSTPVVWQGDNHQLVVLGSGRVASYNLEDGEEIWAVSKVGSSAISVPVIGNKRVYTSTKSMVGIGKEYDVDLSWRIVSEADSNKNGSIEKEEVKDGLLLPQRMELPRDNPGFGFLMPNVDFLFDGQDHDKNNSLSKEEWTSAISMFLSNNDSIMVGIESGGEGDITESHVTWKYDGPNIPEVPSILFCQDRIYSVCDGGVVICLNPESNELLYRSRLDQGRGQYIASPIAARGHIYFSSVKGVLSVIQAGDTFNLVHQVNLGEPMYATPALHENSMYVRTANHLYAFTSDKD